MLNPGTLDICANNWHYGNCEQISQNEPDHWQAQAVTKEINRFYMTEQEQLFAKFYNHEKVLVKDMDHIQLKDHREELQKIAFEAKARLVAADDEARERKAKTSNKEWLVTDTQPDVNVSDAINVVKVRQARMSKMDKLRKQLQDAGIDSATINEMVRNLESKATDNKLKTVTFNVPSTEVSAVQVKESKPVAETKPFDPSSLTFGK
jgi:hypothetical protein